MKQKMKQKNETKKKRDKKTVNVLAHNGKALWTTVLEETRLLPGQGLFGAARRFSISTPQVAEDAGAAASRPRSGTVGQ